MRAQSCSSTSLVSSKTACRLLNEPFKQMYGTLGSVKILGQHHIYVDWKILVDISCQKSVPYHAFCSIDLLGDTLVSEDW